MLYIVYILDNIEGIGLKPDNLSPFLLKGRDDLLQNLFAFISLEELS